MQGAGGSAFDVVKSSNGGGLLVDEEQIKAVRVERGST
jgi:hypothetical protein